MVGARLFMRKSQVRAFVALYVLLALLGAALAVQAVRRGQGASGATGFMIVFGLGMAANSWVRGRRPQVLIHEDFLEICQSRSVRDVRYRNITGVSRPDRNRLLVTLREGGVTWNEVIWVKDLEPAEVEKLAAYLAKRRGGGR